MRIYTTFGPLEVIIIKNGQLVGGIWQGKGSSEITIDDGVILIDNGFLYITQADFDKMQRYEVIKS